MECDPITFDEADLVADLVESGVSVDHPRLRWVMREMTRRFAEAYRRNGIASADYIEAVRSTMTELLVKRDEITMLQARVRELEAELLRVRTAGHGAAHELDNIAVEAGLGHSPRPGVVAAYVRALQQPSEDFIEEWVKMRNAAKGAADADA